MKPKTKGDYMFSNYQTNFYIRKDADDLLWAGLSVNVFNNKFNSYKLSTFILKQEDGLWKPGQSDLIIFDNNNNMYRIAKYNLSQLYNPNAVDREILYEVNLSRPYDKYLNIETESIHLNELLVKNIIDDLKTKTEHSFGINISI